MTSRKRWSLVAGVGLLSVSLLAKAPIQAQDEPLPGQTDRQRLSHMTIAERTALLQNLQTYETLPPGEREAIRRLDAQIAEAAPDTRARYLSLLRRYQAFRETLTESARTALDAETDPARKLAMIAKLREEQKAESQSRPMPYDNAFQISELSRVRLRPIARELVVWFSLDGKEDAKEKAELGRTRDPAKRRALAQAIAREKGLMGRVRNEDEEFREAEDEVRKTLPKPLAEKLVTEQVKAEALRRQNNRGNGALANPRENLPGENNRLRAVMKLDEIQVFRNLDDQPVEAANLDRFERALPEWAHETLDLLPPDAARRRLRILYRLVFPDGTEMPEPKPAEHPKPSSRPAPKRPGRADPVF